MTAHTRRLDWDGCANVRDLGGLPTASGATTRFGSVIRSDNARRLSDTGWQSLLDHGVQTVIDLRWHEELADDPPREVPIDVVHVPLFGNYDSAWDTDIDARLEGFHGTDRVREAYLLFLELYRENMARVIGELAGARDGGVVVHCAAGKDRTGLVVAFLLRLAGVPDEVIAADYAESERNLAHLTVLWIGEATDDEDRQRRQRLSSTPPEAMLGVLAAIDELHGGVREYLLGGGTTEAQIDGAVRRLL
jgi:protein-tyrosine phosphatase